MNKPLLLLVLVAGLVHTATAHAQVAQYPRLSANACHPTTPSVTTFGRGLLGLYNSSTTANFGATCVLPINGSSATTATTTVNSVRVYYNDNNGVSGKTVFCSAYIRSATGVGFVFGTKYSCATPGGCTSSANTYIGAGYLEFSTTTARADAAEVMLMCNVPPIPSGISVSALYSLTGSFTVL